MKKIMFNDKYGLADAVLQGRKTMTRRICKDKASGTIIYAQDVDSMRLYAEDGIAEFVLKRGEIMVSVMPYKVGEVVAVAQRGIDIYHALQRRYGETSDASLGFMEMYKGLPMWNNKLFVPADLCPSCIRITDIKVERLQDISDEDCMLEGIQEFYTPVGKCYITGGVYVGQDSRLKIAKGMINIAKPFKTPSEAFALLIDKVSGKGTWVRNPFVFVYSFELVK